MEQTFFCQSCRARLVLIRSDSDQVGDRRAEPWPTPLHASVFDSGNIDESFIVLDDRRNPAAAAAAGPPLKSLDESFVVLPGSASVLLPGSGTVTSSSRDPTAGPGSLGSGSNTALRHNHQQQSFSTAGPAAGTGGSSATAAVLAAVTAGKAADRATRSSSGNARAAGMSMDTKIDKDAALFELASTVTGVDHPLCLDCAAQLKSDVDKEIVALEAETKAYSEALAKLNAEAPAALSQEDFDREMAGLAAQTAAAEQEQQQAEQQLASVQRELDAQQAIAADIAALEERYWHDLNEYQLSLQQHITDRDSLLNKIDRAGQQLLLLKSTNVLNDTFRIWHDGPFGTISGFRMGRTPECPVEWDEINAAWGQAVLLLHTMAQQCKLNFSAYRLLPMGSHPRVADKRGTYDLFGPVNKLWGSAYDKAMSVYLACLKEFGDFARARDLAEGQQQLFEFPFAIEGDKVGNYTIKLSMLNKDTKWTKALKLMLADLKVTLQWMIQRDMAGQQKAAQSQMPSLAQEGPTHLPAA